MSQWEWESALTTDEADYCTFRHVLYAFALKGIRYDGGMHTSCGRAAVRELCIVRVARAAAGQARGTPYPVAKRVVSFDFLNSPEPEGG